MLSSQDDDQDGYDMFCGVNHRQSPEQYFTGRQTEKEVEEDQEQHGEEQ